MPRQGCARLGGAALRGRKESLSFPKEKAESSRGIRNPGWHPRLDDSVAYAHAHAHAYALVVYITYNIVQAVLRYYGSWAAHQSVCLPLLSFILDSAFSSSNVSAIVIPRSSRKSSQY